MLKTLCNALTTPAKSGLFIVALHPASVQSVRWHRKPRWVPVAKSKIFKVPERRHEDPEERAELMRLHQNYKTQVRAVRAYLFEELRVHSLTSSADHLVVTPEQADAQLAESRRINDEWNACIAAEREQRLAQKLADRKEYILTRLELKVERERAAFEAAEEIVRREKALSKTYILKENLDAAIELALANPVDYNFAIDLQGNVLNGRRTDETNVQSVVSGQQQKVES